MDPAILIILLFVLAPLIERVLKAGKPPQEPPDQQPRPQPRQQPRQIPGQRTRPPAGQAPRGPASRPTQYEDDDDDLAAGMLPDDLWEILTGERRAPAEPQRSQQPHRQPQPRTLPQPTSQDYDTVDGPPASFEDDVEHSFETEYASFETDDADFEGETYTAEPVEIEPYVHEPPVREAPKVVSLEKMSFDAERRHDRFHERLDSLPPAASIRSRRPTRASGLLDIDDLRQAIIMNEVLGPPKGLQ
ncbi:hypothetical protein BH23GEM10_BH23GEM10_10380 [soil metagenome]